VRPGPGHEVDVTVTSSLRDLTDLWRGSITWRVALRSERIRLDGTAALRRSVPQMLPASGFALVPRAGESAVQV
jgi:hypothetical protein